MTSGEYETCWMILTDEMSLPLFMRSVSHPVKQPFEALYKEAEARISEMDTQERLDLEYVKAHMMEKYNEFVRRVMRSVYSV